MSNQNTDQNSTESYPFQSDESVEVLPAGLEMPYEVGDLRLGVLSEETEGEYADCIIYMGMLEDDEKQEDEWEVGTDRYVRLEINSYSIEVIVEDKEVPYDQEEGYWDHDEEEIVRSDSYEYEELGWAFRRLYQECGVDLDKHNLQFNFN